VEQRGGCDHVVVCEGGAALVQIDIDATGVRVRATRARLEVTSEDVELVGRRVAIRASDHLEVHSGGDADVSIAGNRTTVVSGEERVDASAIELQARSEHVDVRSSGAIRIDGEHIALNGDPCPAPFGWSRAEAASSDAGSTAVELARPRR
jgi:hypothetical protein